MTAAEAIAEARENVARNHTSERCVVRALLHAIDRERAITADHISLYNEKVALANAYLNELALEKGKVRALRQAAGNVALVGRTWLTVWRDKFSENSVREFEKAEGILLATQSEVAP